MVLLDVFLIVSITAAITGFYFYSREKRMLQEFIKQSRRHHYHRELDVAMQKKASRYLVCSIVFAFISLPLLIQKIMELN